MNSKRLLQILQEQGEEYNPIKERFMVFQAQHFTLSWQELLEAYAEAKGRFDVTGVVSTNYQREFLERFVENSHLNTPDGSQVTTMRDYINVFGANGLRTRPYPQDLKDFALQIARLNVAYHFGQLSDGEGVQRAIYSLIDKYQETDFVLASRIGNNLASRVISDIQRYRTELDSRELMDEMPYETNPEPVDIRKPEQDEVDSSAAVSSLYQSEPKEQEQAAVSGAYQNETDQGDAVIIQSKEANVSSPNPNALAASTSPSQIDEAGDTAEPDTYQTEDDSEDTDSVTQEESQKPANKASFEETEQGMEAYYRGELLAFWSAETGDITHYPPYAHSNLAVKSDIAIAFDAMEKARRASLTQKQTESQPFPQQTRSDDTVSDETPSQSPAPAQSQTIDDTSTFALTDIELNKDEESREFDSLQAVQDWAVKHQDELMAIGKGEQEHYTLTLTFSNGEETITRSFDLALSGSLFDLDCFDPYTQSLTDIITSQLTEQDAASLALDEVSLPRFDLPQVIKDRAFPDRETPNFDNLTQAFDWLKEGDKHDFFRGITQPRLLLSEPYLEKRLVENKLFDFPTALEALKEKNWDDITQITENESHYTKAISLGDGNSLVLDVYRQNLYDKALTVARDGEQASLARSWTLAFVPAKGKLGYLAVGADFDLDFEEIVTDRLTQVAQGRAAGKPISSFLLSQYDADQVMVKWAQLAQTIDSISDLEASMPFDQVADRDELGFLVTYGDRPMTIGVQSTSDKNYFALDGQELTRDLLAEMMLAYPVDNSEAKLAFLADLKDGLGQLVARVKQLVIEQAPQALNSVNTTVEEASTNSEIATTSPAEAEEQVESSVTNNTETSDLEARVYLNRKEIGTTNFTNLVNNPDLYSLAETLGVGDLAEHRLPMRVVIAGESLTQEHLTALVDRMKGTEIDAKALENYLEDPEFSLLAYAQEASQAPEPIVQDETKSDKEDTVQELSEELSSEKGGDAVTSPMEDDKQLSSDGEASVKKYELLPDDTVTVGDKTLYRIRALRDFGDVKAGDLGGYIEKEANLSHEGNAWVSDRANVYGNAQVYDEAQVFGAARVFGEAQVHGNSRVFENTQVSGEAYVFGEVLVYDRAQVYDKAQVYGKAQVSGRAQVFGAAQVFDDAQVFGETYIFGAAQVFENAQVLGKALVYGKAQVSDNALVYNSAQVYGNTQVSDDIRIDGDTHIASADDYMAFKQKLEAEAGLQDTSEKGNDAVQPTSLEGEDGKQRQTTLSERLVALQEQFPAGELLVYGSAGDDTYINAVTQVGDRIVLETSRGELTVLADDVRVYDEVVTNMAKILDKARLTQVLDTAYNVKEFAPQEGNPNFAKTWERYWQLKESQQLETVSDVIAYAAEEDLIATNSPFYQEWQEDEQAKRLEEVQTAKEPVASSFSDPIASAKDFIAKHVHVSDDTAFQDKEVVLDNPDVNRLEFQSVRNETEKRAVAEEGGIQVAPQDDSLAQIREAYPIGTAVSYNGKAYTISDISAYHNPPIEAQITLTEELLDGKIRNHTRLLYSNLEQVKQALKGISDISNQTVLPSAQEVTKEAEFSDGQVDLFDLPEEEKEPSQESKEEVVAEKSKAEDFSFPSDLTDFYPKTPKDKVAANLAAIRLVKDLEAKGVQASAKEQVVLAKYVGWGGLANTFFDDYNERFKAERESLRALVSEAEYNAMKRSSLTAYYTDPAIIREMFQKLEADGFTGGRILDPSMGTGNFFSAMPKHLRDKSELYGVELDSITGAIAKQLHPSATIFVKGFQEVPFRNEAFDLVTSNIPFADVRIADNTYDKSYVIHDYFVKKSLDLVRDGGQVAVITSTGTMDKRVGNILKDPDLQSHTHFLGGVRLPNTAFKQIAGTSVVTDILYFQKDYQKTLRPEYGDEKAFQETERYRFDQRIFINPYFNAPQDGTKNPQVIGDYAVRNFQGGRIDVTASHQGELAGAVRQGLTNTHKALALGEAAKVAVLDERQLIDDLDITLNQFTYDDDNVYFRDSFGLHVGTKVVSFDYYVDAFGDIQGQTKSTPKWQQALYQEFVVAKTGDQSRILDDYQADEATSQGAHKGHFKRTVFLEQDLTKTDQERIRGMVDIREAYTAVIDIQRNSDYDRGRFEELLQNLNTVYDNFVKRYGTINPIPGRAKTNQNLFADDDKYSLIASLEVEGLNSTTGAVEYHKSEAFQKPLIRPERKEIVVNNVLDALSVSLAERGGVDFDFMHSVYHNEADPLTKEEMKSRLAGFIYPDPQRYHTEGELVFQSKSAVLSGDVLNKLAIVEELIAKGDTAFDWQSLESDLKAVQPERVTLSDIGFDVGSRWIPDEVFTKFIADTFFDLGREMPLDLAKTISPFEEDAWNGALSIDHSKLRGGLSQIKPWFSESTFNTQTGVPSSATYRKGLLVFEAMLSNKKGNVMKTVNGVSQVDPEATARLRNAEDRISEAFQQFIFDHHELASLVEDRYNQLFNRYIPKTYDGSKLYIDGLAKGISLRPHQANAVARILEEERALLAHEVGSGKTLTMLAAGFKLKELGRINKPLFVVPTSLTAQFGQEIMTFFPTKKVLVTRPEDFAKAKRRQFIARIASGDYDAVVIGDSQFERIPMAREQRIAFIEDKIASLNELKVREGANVKDTMSAIEKFQKQLEELQNMSQDNVINFEDLGVDCLFVDEAHHFKNIKPVTALGDVAGITNTTAKKTVDMEMKVQYLQEQFGGGRVVFATGTPVSNSIAEMYTMMHYLQADVLQAYGVDSFDKWVGTFGNITSSMELNTTGDKYKSKKRFKDFKNLPELMRLYRITADIQTEDMLDLPVPSANRHTVVSETTPAQKAYLEELVERSEAIQGGFVDPSNDNMLKITGEAKSLAIDMRLLDEHYSPADSAKLMQLADQVESIWRETADDKGTQMIFSDVGTPSNKGNKAEKRSNFNLYQAIKDELVARGIPEQEIAFIHDANTDTKKAKLSRQMNAGDVRILLASTEKGGTGLNVQQRMKAVHHLDVPWRPSDIIQRNGRLIRQGNRNKEVDIYHYITKGSFDNYLWATQENKLRYISQIMTSKEPVRTAEDIDESVLNASEFKAIATGNIYLKTKMELENELMLLENEKRSFERSQDKARETMRESQEKITVLERRMGRYGADIARAEASVEADFVMEIKGVSYTDKKEAIKALQAAVDNNISDTKEVRTLGHYRDFAIKAQTKTRHEATFGKVEWANKDNTLTTSDNLTLVGDNQYPVYLDFLSITGTVTRLNNTLNGIDYDQKRTQVELDMAKRKLQDSRILMAESFDKEDRYQTVKIKYELLAPLVEQGYSPEKIKEALAERAGSLNIEDTTYRELDDKSDLDL